MNIEQEARDLQATRTLLIDTQEQLIAANNRLFDSRNETHETQSAFDAYRREVSDRINAVMLLAAPMLKGSHVLDGIIHDHLSRFIIPEPVDPLTIIAREMVVADGVTRTKNQEDAIRSGRSGEAAAATNEERLRAALAKIGGKVVFEGEGA